MARERNNIYGWLLALVLLLPLILGMVNLVRQQLLHITMAERFKTESVTTIAVAIEKTIWAKKEKEVIIDGKYFDVKNYTTSGDSLYLTGFFDLKEDRLMYGIKKILGIGEHNSQTAITTIYKATFLPLYNCSNEGINIPGWTNLNKQFQRYADRIKQIPARPNTPPPQI